MEVKRVNYKYYVNDKEVTREEYESVCKDMDDTFDRKLKEMFSPKHEECLCEGCGNSKHCSVDPEECKKAAEKNTNVPTCEKEDEKVYTEEEVKKLVRYALSVQRDFLRPLLFF